MKKLLLLLFLLPATILVTASCDDDDDSPAITLSTEAAAFIETKYPGAVVTGVERSANGFIEVDVLHDSFKKEVYFNKNDDWVFTEWSIAETSLPQAVIDALAAVYPDYYIDDADYVQTPSGDYYSVNIEKGNFEKDLNLLPDGSIIE